MFPPMLRPRPRCCGGPFQKACSVPEAEAPFSAEQGEKPGNNGVFHGSGTRMTIPPGDGKSRRGFSGRTGPDRDLAANRRVKEDSTPLRNTSFLKKRLGNRRQTERMEFQLRQSGLVFGIRRVGGGASRRRAAEIGRGGREQLFRFPPGEDRRGHQFRKKGTAEQQFPTEYTRSSAHRVVSPAPAGRELFSSIPGSSAR